MLTDELAELLPVEVHGLVVKSKLLKKELGVLLDHHIDFVSESSLFEVLRN
jgi:hypothetical protein